MADLPPDADVGSGRESTTGVPRWVKVLGIIAAVLVLLVIAVFLVSGGEHGPGRHMSSGQSAPSVGVVDDRPLFVGVRG